MPECHGAVDTAVALGQGDPGLIPAASNGFLFLGNRFRKKGIIFDRWLFLAF